LTLLAFAGAAAVRADAPPAAEHPAKAPAAHTAVNFFDSARHMHIAEVKPGMTGYGLTVFKGSKIEKFDVEVLSVLKNFNARSDVILIRCKGAYMEHTGSIAGMSGSPIYLTDDTGHARMVGAFAYGWPMTKDPIAGVQPIEYMLKLPAAHRSRPQMSAPATSPSATSPSAGVRDHSAPAPAREHAAWSMRAAGMLPVAWQNRGRGQMITTPAAETKTGQLLGDGEGMRIEPLATPLMTSGMSPELFALLAPRFRAAGLVPLQSGGGGAAAGRDNPVLEPGSVLAVPLLTGDLEMTAIGTTTEVIGNRVWGFGHPFNNEGPISLPMGSGVINGIIANLNTSFKLGSLTRTCGTLNTDESVGVAGETGALPSGVPIEMTVEAADGTPPRTYHFNASRHPKFTPMLTAAAFAAAVTGSSELPQYNTVDYDVQLTFSNGQTVILANRAVNVTSADLFGDAGVVMQAAAENPFQRVMVTRVVGHVKIHPILAAAQIIDVNLPRSKYRPGDKVAAFVTYQPFRSSKAVLRLELELPHDLPHGQYQLIISDAQRYFTDEQVSKPFRFMAESIDDVFAVLRDVGGIRENAIYLRLQRHPDGVAIGRTALQRLPSNRREIMLGAGRSNTTAFISSTVKIVPTELVMTGASEFTIEVETPSKVVVGAPRGAKTEAAAAPKTDEPKKVAPAADVPGKKDTPKESKPRE
jgi:hypothetical protein